MCMFPRYRINRRGSLLVEVLLSVVILATALTLMIQSMTAGLRSIQYADGYTMALLVLDNQMCELFRKGFIGSGLRQTNVPTEPDSPYRYSMRTESWGTPGESNINQVDAMISWRSGKKDNQIGLTTFLFAASP